ncbi:MAG: flagellar assembly protein FliH [Burkholderiaceae bacterium]|nr:MAG: flagellar assembly protein FliH [Burkholderiaceae bacterium]
MSNKRFISREQLQSYERLEWGSLKQSAGGQRKQIDTAAGNIPVQTRALDLEQLQQKAIEEGWQEGYAQGQAQLQNEVLQLQQMVIQGSEAWHQLHDTAANQLLNLALELSRHILRQEIVLHPESILPVVQEAIDTLTDNGSHAHLIANPADAALIRQHLHEELRQGGWKLIEDARLQRGGCRINTNHGEVDATIETRWKRMVSALGRNLPWASPASELTVNAVVSEEDGNE